MLKIFAIDNRTPRRLVWQGKLMSLWITALRRRPYGFSLVNRDSVKSPAHDGHYSKRASGK